MALEPLRIVKNWFTNTTTRERNWDEIADNITSYSVRTNNNLKQIGLDLNGASYEFNNTGKATQTTDIVTRLDAIDAAQLFVVTRNLGLDLSTASNVKLVGGDGATLSSSNKGLVTFNDTATAGKLVTKEITADINLNLVGAHWGLGTQGDFTDVKLWCLLMFDGTDVRFGITRQAGREVITTVVTSPTSANSIDDVLANGAVAANASVVVLGWIKANFDDTGNVGGEDFWTVQTDAGDINIGPHPHTFEGEVRF